MNGAYISRPTVKSTADAPGARETLRVSESRYRRLFETAKDGILLLNAATGQIEDVNPYLIEMLGYTHEEFLGKKLWEVGAFADRAESKGVFAELQATGYSRYEDLPLKTKAGMKIEVEIVSNAYDCDGIKVIQCNIRNISERKIAEEITRRHTQLYAALSQCNEAIVRCVSEDELLLQVCRAAVQFGGIKMAWVGFVETGTLRLRPAGSYGDDTGYLNDLDVRVAGDSALGLGPTGSCVRENRAFWCQDIVNDPSTLPWRDRAARAGFAASASLPLHRNGIVVGAFTLYAGEADAFDESARDLLARMAADISFALDHIAHRSQRMRSEEDMKFKNTILKTQQETSLDAILVVDENGEIISYNQRFIDLWGLSPELVSASVDAPVLQSVVAQVENPEAYVSRVQYLYEHRDEKSREEIQLKDGRIIDRYSAPATGVDRRYYGRVWYFRDITYRRKAERRIAYLNRVYAVLSTINMLIVHVKDRGELFAEACRIAVVEGGFLMSLIAMVDRSTRHIVPVASASKDAGLKTAIKGLLSSGKHAANSMVARAVTEKRAVVSNNSHDDPAVLSGREYARAGVHSMAILPLIRSDKAVGVLALFAGENDFFHEEELKLLLELSGDISFALENIDRTQRLVNLARIRSVSSEINAAIIRTHDRDELFREVCRIAVQSGGFILAWVAVVDPGLMQLRPVAWEGPWQNYLERIPLSLNEADTAKFGLPGRAVCEKKPIIVEDMQRDPRIFLHAEAGERNLRSLVTLPLLVSDTVAGVLSLYADETGFFDGSEMQLLLEVAANITFALDHMAKAEKLNYLAYYDELTGLANRSLFLERVAQYIRSAASGGHRLSLFLIDLERFRNINDSLGRPAGDALLRQFAQWLTQNAGDAGLVGRVDADRFAVVLPVVTQDGDVERVLEKLMAAILGHPYRLNDAVVRVSAKVGVARFPDDGGDADTLLRNAEAALRNAKASGEPYLFHTQKMTEMMSGRLTLENQLRRALDNEEFVLHFQPKISLASGKLTGAEALIRWNDPHSGLVLPGRIIPMLEETGLIYDVGRWALRRAIEESLRWRRAGLASVRIAVNLSPRQLRNRAFVDEIRQAVGIDAQAAAGLELEITENLIMEDVRGNIASLEAIRALGVSIAIDDFGTGFSSLSYLARLPVDTLKIDRSFVVDMTVTPESLALASTIINLAHALKLNVVAEGVETEEQARLLRLLNCDEMQGFLVSKPMSAETFEARFLAPLAAA
jgi:diguanylate cyclase (GGDEF)-like protein/PAS domain S-box-containing protein